MKLNFQYGNRNIEFDLEYRRRKTLQIAVEAPDKVKVAAPLGMKNEEVIEIVKSKSDWIVQKLFVLSNIEYRQIKREFVNGESFMYLGIDYPLQIIDDSNVKKPQVELCNGKIYIKAPSRDGDILKKALEKWYRERTLEKAKERINYYQKYFNKKPTAIRVKEQKKRWASCTGMDEILFNWRCSMAREDAFDYIVVHEMCHIYHKNHSKDFWKLVESIMPDYKERREWLKKYGVRMNL
ncbi:hypothetical protein SAMN05443428_108128 [Caloramator quimbayensis]|uniref:YgjP-like metallopeptidase domain-containing protein n=1 Tax=Caloramator quimbayensis TaxID=1147123 RepID=A0A1T4XG15_9CLOT|nr:SprT family zinc-dependent metalloprotease [Caloramator quimbayensis]SKA88148.1 hypothetical protein SAMN05443428_108128 [Caloramator quimbayensis]